MIKLNPGMVFEDPDGYCFWVLYVDNEKRVVCLQDDSAHVLPPCTRVVRFYQICAELEVEFKIREAHPDEMDRFVGANHLDTIPSPPSFESLRPTSEGPSSQGGRKA